MENEEYKMIKSSWPDNFNDIKLKFRTHEYNGVTYKLLVGQRYLNSDLMPVRVFFGVQQGDKTATWQHEMILNYQFMRQLVRQGLFRDFVCEVATRSIANRFA